VVPVVVVVASSSGGKRSFAQAKKVTASEARRIDETRMHEA